MIRLTFTCGCGFKTEELAEASSHAATTGHILTVQGQIVPDNRTSVKLLREQKEQLVQNQLHQAMWRYAEQNPEQFPGIGRSK